MTPFCGGMSGTKLAEDCSRYGTENSQSMDENILAKAAAIYGDARKHVEKEQEDFNKLLSSQVCLEIILVYCLEPNLQGNLFFFRMQ